MEQPASTGVDAWCRRQRLGRLQWQWQWRGTPRCGSQQRTRDHDGGDEAEESPPAGRRRPPGSSSSWPAVRGVVRHGVRRPLRRAARSDRPTSHLTRTCTYDMSAAGRDGRTRTPPSVTAVLYVCTRMNERHGFLSCNGFFVRFRHSGLVLLIRSRRLRFVQKKKKKRGTGTERRAN